MPTDTTPAGSARWHAQKWMVDTAIHALGIEFDQTRLGYSLGPVRDDRAPAEMAVLRTGVKKLADLLPLASAAATRREDLARRADDTGHVKTAAAHWYAAAQLWLLAAFPLWETTDQLVSLHERKRTAYGNWAAHADHQVEVVDIPFGTGSLPGYFHLPPGFDGTPVPTVLATDGMDSGKEMLVMRAGDEFLERGFAVLAVDGPGQSEAAVHGTYTSAQAWVEAGETLVTWLRNRPEVDDERLVCTGTSFGSCFMTLVAARQPIFRGCGVALPCFEPDMNHIFEKAAPTYKSRHMWMAGLERDEAAFDAMVAGYDLRDPIAEMTVPWFVIGGEADELSPVAWVYELADLCPAPTTTLMYDGATHSMDLSPSVALGPPWRIELIDWLTDRVAPTGPKAATAHNRVTRTGQVIPR